MYKLVSIADMDVGEQGIDEDGELISIRESKHRDHIVFDTIDKHGVEHAYTLGADWKAWVWRPEPEAQPSPKAAWLPVHEERLARLETALVDIQAAFKELNTRIGQMDSKVSVCDSMNTSLCESIDTLKEQGIDMTRRQTEMHDGILWLRQHTQNLLAWQREATDTITALQTQAKLQNERITALEQREVEHMRWHQELASGEAAAQATLIERIKNHEASMRAMSNQSAEFQEEVSKDILQYHHAINDLQAQLNNLSASQVEQAEARTVGSYTQMPSASYQALMAGLNEARRDTEYWRDQANTTAAQWLEARALLSNLVICMETTDRWVSREPYLAASRYLAATQPTDGKGETL